MQKSELKNIDGDNIAEAERIFTTHHQFTEGYRVMFLIQRHADGGHNNNSKLRSYITQDSEGWIIALAKLIQERKMYPNIPLRIYQTINKRNVEKGIRQFKFMSLEADYYDDQMRHEFFIDVHNRMISALMKQSSADESLFLYDIDTDDQEVIFYVKRDLQQQTTIVNEYPSKNGYHVITKPFNPNNIKLPEMVEWKKDAMMLLKYD
jgi:hypothetical protein